MIASASFSDGHPRVLTLLREAIALKLDHLRLQIQIAERRLLDQERRFSREHEELLSTLREGTLAISREEAIRWYGELRHLHHLHKDFQRLTDILGSEIPRHPRP